jgi:putative YhbY family RNA-binding protein
MEPLLPSFRRELRARAHHLHPVVTIGQHGLTPAVLHEIDVALTAHELIKVRIFSDERGARQAMLAQACAALGCAAVQQIGKLLVLWRPRPADAAPAKPSPRPRRADGARAASAAGRRRGPAASAPSADPKSGRRRGTPSAPEPAQRVRPPGKAPAGVPRAAAPRRRRRAP